MMRQTIKPATDVDSYQIDPDSLPGGAGVIPRLYPAQRIRLTDLVLDALVEHPLDPTHPEKGRNTIFQVVRDAPLDGDRTVEAVLNSLPDGAFVVVRGLCELLVSAGRQRAELVEQLAQLQRLPAGMVLEPKLERTAR
jgi:hypothetical protein